MHILTADGLISLLTLTILEIVLGIDNIIFIAILVNKVPKKAREKLRKAGILLGVGMRLLLLLSISWIMSLTTPLFTVFGQDFTGRTLILSVGGLFLLVKATLEIHEKLEGAVPESSSEVSASTAAKGYAGILIQIILLDIVFSFDSVITAVGMAEHISIMMVAMLIASGVMLVAAKAVGDFVHNHPTVKMLALAFLVLIGVTLLMEGLGAHVNKAYIYFAMAFSFTVEMLNLRYKKKTNPVDLHRPRL